MPKFKMSTASRAKKNDFNLSTTHITTMDFDSFRVSNYIPCVQGDSFDINYSQFTRLAPLAVPTFGAFRLKTYAFFVPYRVIWKGFESWYEESQDTSVATGKAHKIKVATISRLWSSSFNRGLTTDGTASSYDICYSGNNTDTLVYRKLTNKGRVMFNVLKALGYPMKFALNSSTGWHTNYLEALPLLVYARVLFDWLYPSIYVKQQNFGQIFDNALTELNEGSLQKICDLVFCAYDQDFYTNAWLKYNSPASGYSSTSQFTAGDLTGVESNADTTGISAGSATSSTTITAAGLRLLQSVSDYVIRNNIVGSRFFERIKARFGFTTQENRHDFSSFLKVWSDDIKLMDVTATTETSSQMLGEQAGKGYSQGGGTLHFTANEFGALIFLSQIVPSIGYVQGQKPWTRPLNAPTDLYTPEFDNVGMQPLPKSELLSDGYHNTLNKSVVGLSDEVFGFVPRYSEYKHGFDFLTGDFTIPSRGMDTAGAYHTFRLLDVPITDAQATDFDLLNDAEFRRVSNQFNRVFALDPQDSSGNSDYDHFFVGFNFGVTAHRNMLSISESLPLFNRSGKDADFDYLGESFH